MPPQPLYSADNVQPAYELRYSWTGWPARPPLVVGDSLLLDLQPLWEGDGLRLSTSMRGENASAYLQRPPARDPHASGGADQGPPAAR